MEPKFQSSFIPKGPISSGLSSGGMPVTRRKQTDFFSLVAVAIFTISIVLAGGVFLYKIFLNYSITQMQGQLIEARATLQPEVVNELIRLSSRIVSTESLVKSHKVTSPIFDWLEVSTPKTVSYTSFDFTTTNKGLELTIQGQARGYAALAAVADVINKATTYFTTPIFSDLRLDEKGNVIFTFRALVQPSALTYERVVKSEE